MGAIKIKIVKYISDAQPGYVECRFKDAWQKEHVIEEKVPVITDKYLDPNSEYPQDANIACEILKNRQSKDGRTILTVSIDRPWGVQTIEGLTEFDVFQEQLRVLK